MNKETAADIRRLNKVNPTMRYYKPLGPATHDAPAYPDGNPKTILGQAKPRMSDTPTQSVRMLGQVHTMGAEKYGAFNWREHNVSSTVYYDAAMRHLMAYFDGENLDAESGLPHLAHVMACASILIDADHHGSLNDNRPLTTTAA